MAVSLQHHEDHALTFYHNSAMFTMKRALVILALAATASTSASAFIPGAAVKNVVANTVQKGARFPLASK
jgi:hypothetical protein